MDSELHKGIRETLTEGPIRLLANEKETKPQEIIILDSFEGGYFVLIEEALGKMTCEDLESGSPHYSASMLPLATFSEQT